jgi:hypothetical protein
MTLVRQLSLKTPEPSTSLQWSRESQHVEITQAGMVTTLNARTSILAAMNPAGCYDASKPVDANTGLPPPLVSRFDIVMVLMDGMDARRCSLALVLQAAQDLAVALDSEVVCTDSRMQDSCLPSF